MDKIEVVIIVKFDDDYKPEDYDVPPAEVEEQRRKITGRDDAELIPYVIQVRSLGMGGAYSSQGGIVVSAEAGGTYSSAEEIPDPTLRKVAEELIENVLNIARQN